MFKNFKIDNARRVEFTGNNIQIPKSKWAYLRNNIDTFHTTGGEGTPSELIDIVNVSSWNKTVCGKNLHDYEKNAGIYDGSFVRITNGYRVTGNITTGGEFASSRGWFQSQANNGFMSGITLMYLPIGQYTISANVKLIENRNTAKIRIYLRGLNDTGSTFTGNISDLTVGQTVRISQTFNVEVANYYTPLFTINSNIVEITNVSTNKGTDTNYTPYTGNTYPYRLEDTDGVLHYGGDLPDGTADTYNRETGQFVEKVLKYTLNNTAEIIGVYNVFSKPNSEVFYIHSTLFGSYSSPLITSAAVRCTHFIYAPNVLYQDIQGCYAVPSTNPPVIACRINDSATGIVKTDTQAEKLTKVRSWLTGQINAGTPPVFLIGLTTPQTYTIKQYGETYGGVVWEYNEKPIQVEDNVCNVFSDKNVKMKFKAVSY